MKTVNQIADELQISRGTVINLIKKGEIKAIQIGDQYRIPEENYDRFISASEVTTQVTGGALPLNTTPEQAQNAKVDTKSNGAAIQK